jgi:hypothetical protein
MAETQHTLPLTLDASNLRPLTFAQWQAISQTVNARADRIRRMIDAEIRRTGRAAGLGDQMPVHLAHNAMCSFEAGKPWMELNYSLVRRVLWLSQRQWEPGRLAESIIGRAWKRVVIHYDDGRDK